MVSFPKQGALHVVIVRLPIRRPHRGGIPRGPLRPRIAPDEAHVGAAVIAVADIGLADALTPVRPRITRRLHRVSDKGGRTGEPLEREGGRDGGRAVVVVVVYPGEPIPVKRIVGGPAKITVAHEHLGDVALVEVEIVVRAVVAVDARARPDEKVVAEDIPATAEIHLHARKGEFNNVVLDQTSGGGGHEERRPVGADAPAAVQRAASHFKGRRVSDGHLVIDRAFLRRPVSL